LLEKKKKKKKSKKKKLKSCPKAMRSAGMRYQTSSLRKQIGTAEWVIRGVPLGGCKEEEDTLN